MDTLTFSKAGIINHLTKQRSRHLKIVQEAQKGYRKRAIELLTQKLKALKANKAVDPNVRLNVPTSNLDVIDMAIEMIQMSIGDTVTLSEREFQCYVRGKWDWEHQFLLSNAAYSVSAANSASK